MQQSQRAAFNPGLEFAVGDANALGLPLIIGPGLNGSDPEANVRHHAFLLQGLAEVEGPRPARLAFVIRRGTPDDVAVDLGCEAAEVALSR